MKNLMPEVAKLLGVEIGEEFKIKDWSDKFYINDTGTILIYSTICGEYFKSEISIQEILNGKHEIIKLPFKPKNGRTYWTVEEDRIFYDSWDNDMMDYSYFKLGNCFRTKEEAEANADRIRKEIMG